MDAGWEVGLAEERAKGQRLKEGKTEGNGEFGLFSGGNI
jgi:hypothetical protein